MKRSVSPQGPLAQLTTRVRDVDRDGGEVRLESSPAAYEVASASCYEVLEQAQRYGRLVCVQVDAQGVLHRARLKKPIPRTILDWGVKR